MSARWVHLGAMLLLASACSGGDAGRAGTVTTAHRYVAAEGDLMSFGPGDATLSGRTVRVLEREGLAAITDERGHWRIEGIPVGTTATFTIDERGTDRYPIQTATFDIGPRGVEQVTLQSPSTAIIEGFEGLLGEATDPDRCHIASTVTRQGYSLYAGAADGTHGEPGATVTLHPTPDGGAEPIYFNGTRFDLIWPDPGLTATTVDGGVVFVNVPPGAYTLRAHKEGVEMREVRVRCRPGVLTNASPPWGLQVIQGGLMPDDTADFPN